MQTPFDLVVPSWPGVIGGSGIPGWVLDGDGVAPAIDLNFALNLGYRSGQLVPPAGQLTCTRASTGHTYDYAETTAGTWVPFVADQPRITDKGLLVEEVRTNQILYSDAQSAANGWQFANCSTSQVDGTTPVGGTAWRYDDGVAAGVAHNMYAPNPGVTVVSGTTYTASIILKPVTGRYIQITGGGSLFGTSQYANFDLSGDGAVGSNTGGTAYIKKYPNGYFLISFAIAASASATGIGYSFTSLSADTASRLPTFNGENRTFDFWNWQFEAGSFATSPILTTSAAVVRNADFTRITPVPTIGTSPQTLFIEQSFVNPSYATGVWLGWAKALSFADGLAYFTASTTQWTANWVASSNTAVLRNYTNQNSNKVAIAYADGVGGAATAANGNVTTGTGNAAPAGPAAYFTLGSAPWAGSASNTPNGYLRRIALWPTTRLSNAALQAITT